MTSTTVARDRRGAPQPAQGGRRPSPTALRLTGRGRVLLLLLLVALLYGAFAAGRSASQAAVNPAQAPVLAQTTVQPGETLWAVARRVAPQQDPRRIVAQLKQLNGLPTPLLRSGQQLLMPRPA